MCAQLEREKKASAFSLINSIGKFNFIWKKINLWKISFQCNSNHHFDSSREKNGEGGKYVYIKFLNNRELMQ